MSVEQIRRLEQHHSRWQPSPGAAAVSTIPATERESRPMRSVETQTDRLEGVSPCCCSGDDAASVSALVPELGHDDEEEDKPFMLGRKGRAAAAGEAESCSQHGEEEVFQIDGRGVTMNGDARSQESVPTRCEPELKATAVELNSDHEEDEEEQDDEEAVERSRRVRLVAANNMFNFNKLEILNERSCSASGSSEGGSQRANITVPVLLRSSSGGCASISDSNRNLCEHEATVAVDDAFAAAASANEQLKQRDGAAGTTVPPPAGVKGLATRLDSLDAYFIQESPEVIL
uniref:Uncharacterized protein n=1 Tax=Anopheles melas TaxID=34690 RepID=A0A182UDQ8_9DIPT